MPESPMLAAFLKIIDLFCKYGKRKGDTCALTLEEFTKMMMEQMPDFFKIQRLARAEPTEKDEIGQLFDEMDKNDDGQVDFNEFVSLVTRVIMSAHPNEGQDALSTNPDP